MSSHVSFIYDLSEEKCNGMQGLCDQFDQRGASPAAICTTIEISIIYIYIDIHIYIYIYIYECFPFYLLKDPLNVCCNPQNSARFCRDNQFRAQMPKNSC